MKSWAPRFLLPPPAKILQSTHFVMDKINSTRWIKKMTTFCLKNPLDPEDLLFKVSCWIPPEQNVSSQQVCVCQHQGQSLSGLCSKPPPLPRCHTPAAVAGLEGVLRKHLRYLWQFLFVALPLSLILRLDTFTWCLWAIHGNFIEKLPQSYDSNLWHSTSEQTLNI